MSDLITQFEPFCGLHYISDTDQLKQASFFESVTDKSFIFNIYYNYFTNIAMSLFKLKNCPDTVNDDFIIRTLIQNGSVAFFKLPKEMKEQTKNIRLGTQVDLTETLIAQPFLTNNLYNFYGLPTSIILQSGINCADTFTGIELDNPDYFEIVKLTPQANSMSSIIYYFVNKITEVQRAIDVNVFNNQTPLVMEAIPEQKKTLEELMKKWSNQLKYIILNKKTGRKEDFFDSKDIGAEWKAGHMIEAMLYYKSEFYTMLGINHTPYEKKANLVKDEVRSNSHILRITIDSILDTLNTDIEKVNNKFGTEMHFEYALDSIYDTSIPSDAESKEKAGIITEEERVLEEIENAKLRAIIKEGEE